MITVEQAKELLMKNVSVLNTVRVELYWSLGCVLAEDVFSPIDYPTFHQSAMDGYAISISENLHDKFIVNTEIKAGDSKKIRIKKK